MGTGVTCPGPTDWGVSQPGFSPRCSWTDSHSPRVLGPHGNLEWPLLLNYITCVTIVLIIKEKHIAG